jgi:hypothetical protein
VAGRDPEDRTRQICNGWKADPWIAAKVLSERTGRLAADLMGWDGVRIDQDNCIWKPPGTKSLGMHQDGSYLDYLVPPEMITCWIALDDTSAEAGTITYARDSHRWPRAGENRGEFHAPDDWLAPVRRAVPAGQDVEVVPIVVRAGGAAFHHHNTFHAVGSPPGGHLASRPRGRRVPPGERRPRLLPLPPGGRHDDGRVLLPAHLDERRPPLSLARRRAPAGPRPCARREREPTLAPAGLRRRERGCRSSGGLPPESRPRPRGGCARAGDAP